MQAFTMNMNEYFDGKPYPVLYARDGQVRYWNSAMDAFAKRNEISLAENEALPEPFVGLKAGTVSCLTEKAGAFTAETCSVDGGVLISLKREESNGTLTQYQLFRFCGKLRVSVMESMLAMQKLYGSLSETQQLKLDPQLEPLLQQYCRMLRMVQNSEIMVQPDEELVRNWGLKPVDVTAVMTCLRYEVQPMLRKRIVIQTEDGLGVIGNEALLRKALLNLISNGLIAGGVVTVSASQSGGQVLLEVKTSGGTRLPDENMNRLFEEESFSTLLRKGGLHFGLHNCWKIFRAHGGSMAVLNQEDGLLVRGQIPAAKVKPDQRSTDEMIHRDDMVPDTLIELSDVLPQSWYSTCDMLETPLF